LELVHILENSGHLCGKKHVPQSDFLHHDLFVLEYTDVDESSHYYKHLDAIREKEKAASSNPNTREAIRAITALVFISLALLCNFCSSAKLNWQVCGSDDGTHGLLYSTITTR
jgi:hypothetical protein